MSIYFKTTLPHFVPIRFITTEH